MARFALACLTLQSLSKEKQAHRAMISSKSLGTLGQGMRWSEHNEYRPLSFMIGHFGVVSCFVLSHAYLRFVCFKRLIMRQSLPHNFYMNPMSEQRRLLWHEVT